MYKYLIFIGRFEPFHLGHYHVMEQALAKAQTLIVLLGSANSPRTIKNPFSFGERTAMIQQEFVGKNVWCVPIDDELYNDQKWLQNIQSAVYHLTGDTPDEHIALIGHDKDESSYYLSLFPQWQFIKLANFKKLSATPMRERYFLDGVIDDNLPASSARFLKQFVASDEFVRLQTEYRHILDYQRAWQHAPYPPVFVTADALVVQAGHILLIERGGEYGRGLFALAGGFLDQSESLFECAVRELFEETGLVVDKTALKASQTFDNPERSLRGRTVTTVFYFELHGDRLPALKAGDDAVRAFWLPLAHLDGRQMFEDHYSIIKKMLAL